MSLKCFMPYVIALSNHAPGQFLSNWELSKVNQR